MMDFITYNLRELYLPDAIPGGASTLVLPLFVVPGNYCLSFGGRGTWHGDRMKFLEV